MVVPSRRKYRKSFPNVGPLASSAYIAPTWCFFLVSDEKTKLVSSIVEVFQLADVRPPNISITSPDSA